MRRMKIEKFQRYEWTLSRCIKQKERGEKEEGRGEGEGREKRRRKINLKRVRRKENDIDRLPT